MIWYGLLAVVGAFFGHFNPILQFPPLILAFPAALAVLAFRSISGRACFRTAYLASLTAVTACLYWVSLPPHDFGGLPWILAAPCPMLMAAIMALYYASFAWSLRQAARVLDGPLLVLFAGLAWTVQELAQNVLFTGFPWLTLSSALAPWPGAIQGAAIIGAYGLSGVYAALAVCIVRGVNRKDMRVLACGIVLTLAACGWWGLTREFPGPVQNLALIQGNIDQSLKWDKAYQDGTVDKYLALTQTALDQGPLDLIIWPETALPCYFQESSPLTAKISLLARTARAGLLFGSPAYRHDFTRNSTSLHNRAWLLDETGKPADWYDKEHLVPFGEYVPLQEWFPWLPLNKLVEGVGEFAPGTRVNPLRLGPLALGVLICYEGIFPELAQARVAAGATLLVSISNDAWFGRSSAPGQHLGLTVLRAVEQGRFVARGTNTGISALIAPTGQVTARTNLFTDAALTGQATALTAMTPFHQTFAFWPWLYLGGFAGLGWRVWTRIKRAK